MSGISQVPMLSTTIIDARKPVPVIVSTRHLPFPEVNMGKRSRLAAVGLLGYDHCRFHVFCVVLHAEKLSVLTLDREVSMTIDTKATNSHTDSRSASCGRRERITSCSFYMYL